MRAKWRKAIWAILALQLLLWHLLFLEKYFHWKKLAILIWFISAVFVMALHYLNYTRFRRYCINRLSIVSEADIRENLETAVLETGLHGGKSGRSFLYRGREVREPFLIGFREPVLVLPDREYSAQVLHFIFLHECYHMRHRDMLYKLFMLFIQSLLWFQPLIYLLKAISYQDVEVACDEAVVEGKDISARKEYGYALLECLKMERVKGQAYSTYFYHGKRMMKARISAIMKEDKRWDFLAYCCIGILLLDVTFNLYRIGGGLYESHMIRKEAELAEESFYEGYAQADFSDIPKMDLVYGIETASLETSEGENSSLSAGVSENAYQVDTSEGVLRVSGADGKWQEASYLFHTADGGKSWQYVGPVPDVLTDGHSLTTGAAFINNNVGFFTIRSSDEPDIWRTQDGGKTWEYLELPYVPEYYGMAYTPEVQGDILCLYVGMEDYTEYGGTKAKYESADEGKTWEYKGLVIRK